ncbi:MAG: hypothetical protein NTW58_09610 [Actinobacteria bacterium]|nr:hypothetical protein [Actinomycetota bacterium]
MKIARLQTTPLALAFKDPYHWAGHVDHAAAVVLVEDETDDGLVGIGESVAAFPAEGNQITHQLLVEDLVSAPDLTPVQGKIGLLETPGLGVELDWNALHRAAELYRRGQTGMKEGGQ